MIQDLTPGNLLVDDEYPSGTGGMRLLLSDPAMAQPISQLKGGDRCAWVLWRPLLHRWQHAGPAGRQGQLHCMYNASVVAQTSASAACLIWLRSSATHALPQHVQRLLPHGHLTVGLNGGVTGLIR